MEKEDLIVGLLKETRDSQKELAENSVKHREESLVWQSNTDHRLENIEVDLREHKEGVVQNRETIQMFHQRLEELESPKKAFKKVTKVVIKYATGTTVITSAIYGIIRLLSV